MPAIQKEASKKNETARKYADDQSNKHPRIQNISDANILYMQRKSYLYKSEHCSKIQTPCYGPRNSSVMHKKVTNRRPAAPMMIWTHLQFVKVVREGNDVSFAGPAEISWAYLSPHKVKTSQGTIQAIPVRLETVKGMGRPQMLELSFLRDKIGNQ